MRGVPGKLDENAEIVPLDSQSLAEYTASRVRGDRSHLTVAQQKYSAQLPTELSTQSQEKQIDLQNLFIDLADLEAFSKSIDGDVDQYVNEIFFRPLLVKALQAMEQQIALLPDSGDLTLELLTTINTTCENITRILEAMHHVSDIKDPHGATYKINQEFKLIHGFLQHDLDGFLRNPSGYAEGLIEDEFWSAQPPPEQTDFATDSEKHIHGRKVNNYNDLIKTAERLKAILPFMRVTADAIVQTTIAYVARKPEVQPFRLKTAVEPLIDAAKNKHRSKYPDLAVDLHIEDDLVLVGDKNIVAYSVYIALDNAIKKFRTSQETTSTRVPKLSVTAVVKNGVVSLKVKDDGPGVDKVGLVKAILKNIDGRIHAGADDITPFEMAFKKDPLEVLRTVGSDAIVEYLNTHGITIGTGGTGVGLEIDTAAIGVLFGQVRVYDNNELGLIPGATTESLFPQNISDDHVALVSQMVGYVVKEELDGESPRSITTILARESQRDMHFSPKMGIATEVISQEVHSLAQVTVPTPLNSSDADIDGEDEGPYEETPDESWSGEGA